MANQALDKVKITPPYLPFVTFTTFIEVLKNTTIPPRIDSSVTRSLSGQMRGALNTALEFFGLVDKERKVEPKLKIIVEAFQTDGWKKSLAALLTQSYLPILDGLDISNATSSQLKEQFRENGGVDGQVLEKALRFYLAAMDEAAVSYSPLFKARGALTARKKSKTRKAGSSEEEPDLSDDKVPPALDGLIPFVVPFPDKAPAKFWLPKNITADDWAMIDTIGRAYVTRITKVRAE